MNQFAEKKIIILAMTIICVDLVNKIFLGQKYFLFNNVCTLVQYVDLLVMVANAV